MRIGTAASRASQRSCSRATSLHTSSRCTLSHVVYPDHVQQQVSSPKLGPDNMGQVSVSSRYRMGFSGVRTSHGLWMSYWSNVSPYAASEMIIHISTTPYFVDRSDSSQPFLRDITKIVTHRYTSSLFSPNTQHSSPCGAPPPRHGLLVLLEGVLDVLEIVVIVARPCRRRRIRVQEGHRTLWQEPNLSCRP